MDPWASLLVRLASVLLVIEWVSLMLHVQYRSNLALLVAVPVSAALGCMFYHQDVRYSLSSC